MTEPTNPPPGNQPQYGDPGNQPHYGQPVYGSDQQQGGFYTTDAVTRPPAIDKAVLLMKIGAVLSLLGLLPLLFMRDAIRTAIEKALRDADPAVTSDTVNASLTFGTITAVAMGLIGAGLWWWMAVMNGKGKSWARILSTIFFLLSLALSLPSLFSGGDGTGALGIILTALSLAVGAAAVFFMWQKESSSYYEAASRA